MGFPDRQRYARARLEMEALEDRTTPAKLDEALSLALPELVATGAVLGDRVNVVMTSEITSAVDTAALAAAPFVADVQALGFGIYSVALTAGTDLVEAIEYYGQVTGVVSAAPDTTVQVQRAPNDPQYSQLYGMTKIGAPAAWDRTTGNPNFVVAVIDTGVDHGHPDLAANMWRNPGEIAGDGRDNDGNGFVDDVFGADFANNDGNPFDDNGHGTHVAGTIGAVGNNGAGVAGVNWSVKIMALKFLRADGSGYTSSAVRALDYAVAKGAKVSNNSWGGGGYDATLAAAIGRARTAGHIFVAAAGNNGQNLNVTASYPASYIQSYDNIVTVAATDGNDTLANFSNYGATAVTLAAPGVNIRSTTPKSTYSTYSGTSMAAPHVAGAIALYWGANPTLTYQQVIAKLKSSVDVLPDLNGKVGTSGRLNVAKMFASPPTVPPAVAPGPKVTAATFAATPNVQFNGVRVVFDRAIAPATFTASDVALTGPNGAITGFSITPVAGTTTRFDIGFVGRTAGTYSITIGPDVRDTLGNPMNQDGDAVAGEVTGDRFFASATLVTTVTRTFATPALSLALNDFATTVSTINVTDDVKISDLNARVSLTHTYDSDLVVTLTAPTVNGVAGKTVTLFNRRGGSGDNLTNTGFDDEAVTAIAGGAAPFNGTFRPDGLLSAFDGLSTKGVWTLRVTDNATFDVGRLTGWSFTVAGTVGAGAARVQSFGFRDEPTAFDDSVLEALVEPVAVDSTAPSEDTSAEPATADDSTTGSASVVFVWTDADRDQRESDAPQVVVRDGAECENRPAPIDGSVPAPPDVPDEALALAPDSSESEEDVFDAFAVE